MNTTPADPATLLRETFFRPVKRAIAGQVAALFADRGRSQSPVVRSADSMFGANSVAWRVHGDVTTMMIGGIAGLLLQMLHPAVLAGVWDHSNFRADMQGRLRRTARFIALTTYGPREDAQTAIARVRGIHAQVTGTLQDGTPYWANDPASLAWVHVTEAICFLAAYRRYAEPAMRGADQDRYFAEMAQVATALGADPVPRTAREAAALLQDMRPGLRVDDRTFEVAHLVLTQPAPHQLAEPVQALTMQAALDLLPAWARDMHGRAAPSMPRPLVRAGAFGMASTLRWAFAR